MSQNFEEVKKKYLAPGLKTIGVLFIIIPIFQTWETLKETEATESAKFVLDLDKRFDEGIYKEIDDSIQENHNDYHLLKDRGGEFRRSDVENYIGMLETLGVLVKDGALQGEIVYDIFSFQLEKAWCNKDVQYIIKDARSTDQSSTRIIDPYYANFGKLYKDFTTRDNEDCKKLDKEN